MMNSSIAVIILTLNEEMHMKRCLDSIMDLANEIIIVDSFSKDRTVKIAKDYGATILKRRFTNHAEQFNWALDKAKISSEWVFRIDADEIVLNSSIPHILNTLASASIGVDGFSLKRSIKFLDKTVKFGGVGRRKVVRIFRKNMGRCELKRMDEHIVVFGKVNHMNVEIIDWNLNSISWWISKHNDYATKEALEVLMPLSLKQSDDLADLKQFGRSTYFRRILKENIYLKLPLGIRAFVFFIYRFIILLGFLDGRAASFHVLNGLWYRYLVDLKISEIKRIQEKNKVPINTAIEEYISHEKKN
jgi:glycosyltransferase involved in cell wall biosynthesis